MKIATVGTSKITEQFISALKTGTDIRLIAVYSRSEEKAEQFAEKHSAALRFSDLNEMARCPEFDAVYIASPNALHEEQCELFLSKGKHVLCEKPMTTTEAAQEKLFTLAETKELVYMEAIMSVHTQAFETLRRALSQIGRIRTVNLCYHQLSSKYPAYLNGELPNIFNPEMKAGCLMDLGVYPIYIAAALFGNPERIVSSAVFLDSGADASGSAILSYPGFDVNLSYSKVAQGYSPSEILGDRGTILIDSVSQLTGIHLRTKETSVRLVPDNISRDAVMAQEAQDFERTVRLGYGTKYAFMKDTAFTVRRITDEIRRQNGFPF